MKSQKLKQKGFSMVEVMIVITVIALLGVMVFWAAGKARNDAVAKNSIDYTNDLIGGITSAFPSGKFTGLSPQVLIQGKFIADKWIDADNSGASLKSPWDGDVTVEGAGANNLGWLMTFGNFPKEACHRLPGATWQQFTYVSLNGEQLKTTAGQEFDGARIAQLCESVNVLALGYNVGSGGNGNSGGGSTGPDTGINPVDPGPGGNPTLPGGGGSTGPDTGINPVDPGPGGNPTLPVLPPGF